MARSVTLVELVSKLLDSGKYKDAVEVLNNENYSQQAKEYCSELIFTVVKKIQDDTITLKPSLYGSCEQLLSIIKEKPRPEAALLEFIENIGMAKNDAQFSLLLTPMQQLLKVLPNKRNKSLIWCLNSISTYIEDMPVPEYNLEAEERLLLDSDPAVRRVFKVYSVLPSFYTPFIDEISLSFENVRTKQIIAAFLIFLLGKPMLYVDVDSDKNSQSEIRQCCKVIFEDICKLEKDLLKFLYYVGACYKTKFHSADVDEDCSPYEQRAEINLTTLSGLFYVTLSGHFDIPSTALPQVYNIFYVSHTVMICAAHLLQKIEYGPLAKGMALCKFILNNLPSCLSHTILISSIHFELCKHLLHVAIYSNFSTIRKQAIGFIDTHVNKFEYKGRCMLIKYIVGTANHSGMIGYAITLYKNALNEAFKEPKMPDCFIGDILFSMIKRFCYLEYGALSDIAELADQIIATLNCLRYIVLRDKENITGIRQYFEIIENGYLAVLRTGLALSKAHYEEKLKEIERAKVVLENEVNVPINIAGQNLTHIPPEKKKEIVHSALNMFHLIEGLVARLSECININISYRACHKFISPKEVRLTPRLFRNYGLNTVDKEVKTSTITVENEDHEYEDRVKNLILEKALEYVLKTGWSVESLSAGAKAAGYPTITHGLFPNGGGDLVHYFNIKCNEQLVGHMKMLPKEGMKESKVPTMFIENAIMTRISMIDPYKSTWPKAMAIQTLPNNVPNCLATLLSLVDDICYYSGDRSVDFNWYMRRVGLAGIYKAAELYYLTDNSQGCNATRTFVLSRIRDAQLIQTALNLNPVSAAPQTLAAAFITAKNMLGINTLK